MKTIHPMARFIKSAKMQRLTRNFIADEHGQDLIEYALLLAFVVLASAALFIGAGSKSKGIWGAANTQLTAANTSAS
jgi:Flp pilus assembly pilin Flp